MALNTVTVTWDEADIGLAPLGGTITFRLNEPVTDSSTGIIINPDPSRGYHFLSATGASDPLVANDNPTLQPAGSYYTITVFIAGTQPYSFASAIDFANGATQTVSFLQANAAVPAAPFASFLPLPSGSPLAGQVPGVIANGSTATEWVTIPGASGAVTLTDAPTIAVNAALGGLFRVTLGGNRVLGFPANGVDGQLIRIEVTQDGTGNRTLSYASGYDFGSAGAPVLSTTAGKEDTFGLSYKAATSQWNLLAFAPGY